MKVAVKDSTQHAEVVIRRIVGQVAVLRRRVLLLEMFIELQQSCTGVEI